MTTRKTVFLSASIPIKGRDPFYSDFEERSAFYRRNIREAVLALVGVCYELDLDLVFGGHPAITPLVHRAAKSLGHDFGSISPEEFGPLGEQMTQSVPRKNHDSSGDRRLDRVAWKIVVYQSMYYENFFPPEVRDFQNRHAGFFEPVPALSEFPVPLSAKDINQHAAQLNIAAMRDRMINDFDGQYCCGVFIGGMEGIMDEFARFRSSWPDAPCLPLTSTGGATAMGWPTSSDAVFLSAIPKTHPRPPQEPLRAQVAANRATADDQVRLLLQDAEKPGQITYRTLFRRLIQG